MGMQITKMSTSSKNMQESAISGQSMIAQIENYLENVYACANTFSNPSPINASSGGVVSSIRDKDNNIIIETNKTYDGVKITSMNLRPPRAGDGSMMNAANIGFLDLEVMFQRKEQAMGTKQMMKKLRIWVQTNAGGVITKCSSVTVSQDNLWRRSYWDASNITYQGGRVGAGGVVGAITRDLNVLNGKLRASTPNGDKITIESASGTPSYKIAVQSNLPIAFRNSATAQGADIEVATLKVHDDIKTGPVAETCSSLIRGSVRYNTSLNKMQVCAQVETDYPPTGGTPVCVSWKWSDEKVRVRYEPSGPLTPSTQQPNTPYLRTNNNNQYSTYSWRSGTCGSTRTFSGQVHTLSGQTAAYRCSNSTTNSNPNPSGNRWCKRCIYTFNPPPYLEQDFIKPDPPDVAGETVLATKSANGITYYKTTETDIPAVNEGCRETEISYSLSDAFRWITLP